MFFGLRATPTTTAIRMPSKSGGIVEGIHDGATRAAIAEVMRSVRSVSKDQVNSAQHFRFRGIDDVLNAVGPAIRDQNITVMPYVEEIQHESRTTGGGKLVSHYRVRVRYHFQVPHGEVMVAVSAGEAMDFGDKGLTKAMSVAYRTLWIQALALPTGERDPDQDTYEVEPQTDDSQAVNVLRKAILKELTGRTPPWTLSQIEADFADKVGGSIRDASVDALRLYLDKVRQ